MADITNDLALPDLISKLDLIIEAGEVQISGAINGIMLNPDIVTVGAFFLSFYDNAVGNRHDRRSFRGSEIGTSMGFDLLHNRM